MDPLIQQDKDPQKNHQENRAEKHCKFCFVFPYLFHKRSLFLYKTANAFIILGRGNRFYRVYVNTMKKAGQHSRRMDQAHKTTELSTLLLVIIDIVESAKYLLFRISKLATPISNGGLTLTPPGYSTGIR